MKHLQFFFEILEKNYIYISPKNVFYTPKFVKKKIYIDIVINHRSFRAGRDLCYIILTFTEIILCLVCHILRYNWLHVQKHEHIYPIKSELQMSIYHYFFLLFTMDCHCIYTCFQTATYRIIYYTQLELKEQKKLNL